MNALLIENQYVADRIARDITNIELFHADECNSVETLAEAIPDNYDIYIIHANIRIGNGTGVANSGIKLLKLLRLRHINSHVIVYSWLDKEMLMEQNIRNAILFTKGVSFYKLPDFLGILQNVNLENLSKITADRQELIQLFRAEYDPDDRHFNANIIGAWQLMRVQDAYEEISGTPSETSNSEDQDTDYDKSRKQILNYLNTYNGRLVQYLGNYCSVESMKAILRNEITAHDRQAILDAGKQAIDAIEGIDRTLSELDSQIKIIQSLLVSEQRTSEQQSLLNSMLRIFNNRVEQKLNERVLNAMDDLKEQKERLEREKRQWNWKKERSEQLSKGSNILKDNHEDVHNSDVDLLKEKISALRTHKPHIIYVDDMAEDGWACVLRRIIYGNNTEDYHHLTPITPHKEDTPESIVQKIQEANVFEADLLILDLRLKDERGFVEPSELSGFRVLELLRKTYLTCPILIITASNKVWSLKEAFNDNVVAFWIKAGMEQYDNENAFVKNYINLVDLIHSLTTKKWIFDALSIVKKMVVAIENAGLSSFWWETQKVEFQVDITRKKTDKKDVIRILNRVVSIIQNNLRQYYFSMGNMLFSDVCRMFVTELHFVMEEITFHNGSHTDNLTISKKLDDCGKQCGIVANTKFLFPRNDIVHHGLIAGQNEVSTYLYGAFKWLLETPSKSRAGLLSRKQPIVVLVNTVDTTPDENVVISYFDGKVIQDIIVDKNTEISRRVKQGDYIMVVQYNTGNPPVATRKILDYFKMN